MKRLILFISVACVLLGVSTQAVAAEPQSALRISPLSEQVAVDPGQTLRRQIYLTNLSPLPLPVKGYARIFTVTDESGGSDYPDDPTVGSVQTWFKLDEPDIILQPGVTRLVGLSIQVPADAQPGGHYATLFFESLVPDQALSENSLYLSTRLGVLYFFTVSGDIQIAGSYSEFKTPKWQQIGPIDFDILFENRGNVNVKPKSQVAITDWRGKKVATIEDAGNNVLPGKFRRWSISWGANHLFGRYTARIETKLSEESPLVYKEVSFWVVPTWELLGLILFTGVVYIFGIRARGRWKRAIRALGGK